MRSKLSVLELVGFSNRGTNRSLCKGQHSWIYLFCLAPEFISVLRSVNLVCDILLAHVEQHLLPSKKLSYYTYEKIDNRTKTITRMFNQPLDVDNITLIFSYIVRGTGLNQSASHYQHIHGNFQCDFPTKWEPRRSHYPYSFDPSLLILLHLRSW